jgi:23S rRNA (adenine2503-C2)-methyltransferase
LKVDLKSLTREELENRFQAWGEKKYRVDQVLDWLYRRRVASWSAMSNLPQSLRENLAGEYSLNVLALVTRQGAADTTQKFLWRLPDGALIESVLIPANPALYGEASDRHTLCVSTQVGCAYGCKFCASGLNGWQRNLGAEEIVEQVVAVERWNDQSAAPGRPAAAKPPHERLINNLVIMGMGEPLANYANLLRALRILNAPWGGGLGARKITVSTSGLAPQIRQLAREPFQFRLAISLHAATDAVRNRLMPVNRKYPLRELMAACEDYLAEKGRLLAFEYILLAGVNDRLEQAGQLASLAERLHARVNLIPYNPVDGLAWKRPAESVQTAFLGALKERGIAATLRLEKGVDIDAACGQLRLRTERARAAQTSPVSPA